MNNMYDWEGDEIDHKFEDQAKLIRQRLEQYREDQTGLVVTSKHLEAVEKNSEPLNRIAGNIDILAANQVQVCKGIDAIIAAQDKLLQSHAAVKIDVDSIEDFQDKYHVELAERLVNLEVAFTVRLQAIENKLEAIENGSSADWLQTRTMIDLTNRRLKSLERPNGKHPAGKRK